MSQSIPADVDTSLLSRFGAIVGSKYLITAPAAQEPYLVELRGLYRGRAPAVLMRALKRTLDPNNILNLGKVL
jgi:FAD linked oxidases, C-terminal domain